MSWLERLPRRGLFFLMIFLVAIPLLRPFPVPIPITSHTRRVYEIVEALEPGSVVLYGCEVGTRDIEMFPMNLAAFYQIVMESDARLIIYNFGAGSALGCEWLLEDSGILDNKEYGVDYVHIGFVPGADVGLASFVEDILSTRTLDHYGNRLIDLPLFQEVKNINDIDLICVSSGATEPGILTWSRIAIVPFNKPALIFAPGATAGLVYDQIALGIYDAGIMGQRAAAEYETLLNRPGRALATFAPLYLIYAVEILLLFVGNVAFWYKRREGEM